MTIYFSQCYRYAGQLNGWRIQDMDFKTFSKLIMIEQTFFALPFALIGVLFAGGGTFFTWILVIIALTAARTAGMSFNRVIDADIDGKNPRTKDRSIPAGEVTPAAVWITAIVSSLVLILSAKLLNDLCFYLSFPAVILLFTYSYFKRFSQSAHFYLGFVEAAAPIGGYFAVTGEITFLPFLLGFAILLWIAGLDIVYALQDMEFDKTENLFSIPSVYGRDKALMISRFSYLASIIVLVIIGQMAAMGTIYYTGIFLVALIFAYQQKLAVSRNVAKATKMFFKVNMFVSPILFFSTLLDKL